MENAMKNVIEVNEVEFDKKLAEAEGLVLVDFWAQWCGPCKRMLPELEAAAEQFVNKVTFLKVDIDQHPDLATRYGIQGIPNMTLFRKGQVVDTAVGLQPKSDIIALVNRNL